MLISRALSMGDVSELPPIDLSLRLSDYVNVSCGSPHIRDIWARQDVHASADGVLHFPAVAAHDSVFLLVSPAHGC